MQDREIRAALDRIGACPMRMISRGAPDYREDAVLDYPQSGERVRGLRNTQCLVPGSQPEALHAATDHGRRRPLGH